MAVTGPISGVGPIRLRFLPGGPAGPIGLTGRGITSTAINGSGHLIITYSDASIVDAGLVVGPAGAAGPVGATGRSITAVAVNPSNHLIVTFNDGGTLDAGVVVGPVGPTGRGVQVAAIDGAGHLIITYTDLTTTDAGQALGAAGAAGRRAGLPLTWSSDNTNSNPGTAAIKVNNGTLGAATELYVSDTDADGKGIAKLVGAAAESLGNKRGRIEISDVNLPSNFASFDVTGPAVLNGGWTTVPVVHRDHGGTIINGAGVLIFPVANGEKGDTGATGVQGNPGATGPAGTNGINGESPGMQWAFTPGTADSDPGNGNFRLNTPDPTTATLLYIDNVEFRAGTLATTWLDAIDDATNGSAKGQIAIAQVDNRANFIVYQVTGSVTDVTGYRHVPVLWLSGSPNLPTGPCVFQFSRSGDRGQDGAGGNMFGAVGTGLDGHIALFDGDGFHVRDGGPEGVLANLNTVNNNQWGPGAPLSVANGGTGGTTIPTAQAGLSLVPGVNVQIQNVNLQSLAAIGGAADTGVYFTGVGTMASFPLSAFGRAFGGLPNAASARTSLGLVPGTDVQPFDLELSAIASTVSGANLLPFFTGSGTAATTPFTSYGRTLVGSVDAAGARTNLGLGNVAVLNNTAMGPLSGITTLNTTGNVGIDGNLTATTGFSVLGGGASITGTTTARGTIVSVGTSAAMALYDRDAPEDGAKSWSLYAQGGVFTLLQNTVGQLLSINAASGGSVSVTGSFGVSGGAGINGTLTVGGQLGVTGNISGSVFTTQGSDPTTGTVYFGNTGTKYIYYSGGAFATTGPWDFGGNSISNTLNVSANNALVVNDTVTPGVRSVLVEGPASGTTSGAVLQLLTPNSLNLQIGNKSAILGGAYSAQPFIYTGANNLELSNGLNAGGPISTAADAAAVGIYLKGRPSDNIGILSFSSNAGGLQGQVWCDDINTGRLVFNTGSGGARLTLDSTAATFGNIPLVGISSVASSGIVQGTNFTATGGRNLFNALNEPFSTGMRWNSATPLVYLGATQGGSLQVSNAGGGALLTVDNTGIVFATSALITAAGGTPDGNAAAVRVGFGTGNGTWGQTFRCATDNGNSILFFNPAGGLAGLIAQSATAVSYNTSSDGNLKEDLRDFDSSGFFDRVKVYDFAWRADGSRGIGCVAQELHKVEPRAVTPGSTVTTPATEDEPEHETEVPWGVDYSKLVPHLIAEVQALRARVAHLEAGR